MKHLYVHVPFCRSRCAYCDFASEPVGPHARAGRVERYLSALRAELQARVGAAVNLRPEEQCETIYLGGGTPTVLPRELLLEVVGDLAARLAPAAKLGDAALGRSGDAALQSTECGGAVRGGAAAEAAAPEFTIEANPGTVDADLLSALAAAGVTRLSLGIQSFAPALRAALGRRVEQREIEATLDAIRSAGWREWNLDLVFGIPGQTWEAAAADIDAAAAAGPTHISLYDLTYTARYTGHVERNLGGGASGAAATFAEERFGRAVARLEAAGYRRYEVSNFALPGHQCRHNQAYWRGEDYVGIGVSAVSTVDGERRTNPRTVGAYLAGEAPEIEVLSAETKLWEKAMLGLRTREGIDLVETGPVLDREAVERLRQQGVVEGCCGKLRLNKGFVDVSNAIIVALLVRPGGSRELDSLEPQSTSQAGMHVD